jgi:hypothetical protein
MTGQQLRLMGMAAHLPASSGVKYAASWEGLADMNYLTSAVWHTLPGTSALALGHFADCPK